MYFVYLGKKTSREAANQAKVDVAKAKRKGEIGANKKTMTEPCKCRQS